MPEEPSLSAVLAAVEALSVAVEAVRTDLGGRIDAAAEEAGHRFDRVDAAVTQLRADVAAVKVDTGYLEAHSRDHQTAIERHAADPHGHPRAA